jgi:nicotinamidase-related amidase
MHGTGELEHIERTIPKISMVLGECHRRHLVKSEYSVGQFTDGNSAHVLANLCVPGMNNDCEVISEFAGLEYHSHTTKNYPNALTSEGFLLELERDMELGVSRFVLAGFLLEHCVLATAEALRQRIPASECDVIVASDLCASRLAKYKNGVVTSAISTLRKAGIHYAEWRYIN